MATDPNMNDFAKKMMSIFGLPKHTRSFELRVAVDEIVSIKCEYYPEIETGKLETALIEYDICKKVTNLDSKAQEFKPA